MDRQLHVPAVIESGNGQVIVHNYRNNGVVQQSGKGGFHPGGIILDLNAFHIPACGLGNVIGIGQSVPFAQRRTGKDLNAVVAFHFCHISPKRSPTVCGGEHSCLRVLDHNQGNIAGTVHRVITLHCQIPGIGFRVGRDFNDPGILHSDDIFPLSLLLRFPLGIVLCFVGDDFR